MEKEFEELKKRQIKNIHQEGDLCVKCNITLYYSPDDYPYKKYVCKNCYYKLIHHSK